jgi:hypothetical protein
MANFTLCSTRKPGLSEVSQNNSAVLFVVR